MYDPVYAGNEKKSYIEPMIPGEKTCQFTPAMPHYRPVDGSPPSGVAWHIRALACVAAVVLVAALWATIDSAVAVRTLQKQLTGKETSPAVQDLKERVALLETILAQVVQDVEDLRDDSDWGDDYYELKQDDGATQVSGETTTMS